MKTFDRKDVFSWSNAKEAKQYINKEGYFSDDLDELNREINENKLYPLKEVYSNSAICFVALSPVGRWSCGLFIPADKVKEVEEPKKWRPFKSIDEFKKETRLDLLSTVQYRDSIEKPRNLTTTGFGVITDFCTCSDKTYYITIGDTSFNLDELFNYEYFADNEWKPFGVEE